MFGTLMVRYKVPQVFECLNRRDVEGFLQNWTDDGVFYYPGDLPISGEVRGKETIGRWFTNVFEQFPEIRFIVRDLYIRDGFSFTGNNSVAVRLDVEGRNRHGREYKVHYMTLIHLRGGKAYRAQDFPFNYEAIKEAWREQ